MVSLGKVDSAEDLKGGGLPLPGWYHVVVASAVEEVKAKAAGGESHYVEVGFEILAGTTPGQEGKKFREKLYLTEKAEKRLWALGMATRLLNDSHYGKPLEMEESALIGLQCCVKVDARNYTDSNGQEKQGIQVGFLDFHDVAAEEVANCPKCAKSLSLLTPLAKKSGTAAAAKKKSPAPAEVDSLDSL